MINFNSTDYKNLSDKEKRELQERFHKSDLTYFSSFAFEANAIKTEDLEELNKAIDKRVYGNSFGFNLNVFIALALGIFIGCSVFFVWSEKNKTFASHYENINSTNQLAIATLTLPQPESTTINNESQKPEIKEHFSISESGEQLNLLSPMEDIEIKDINSIDVKSTTPNESEELLNYIPNASVIFIHDLKVANYKGYYFKNSNNIDIRENGLSAQFANKEEATNNLNKRLQDRDYYAHEIIKDAMRFFNKKQYTASVELLDLLKGYNKDDVNTQFYLGMSYYYLGNYSQAINCFEKATTNDINIFLQESEFYSALCLKKSGKTSEANELLKKIVNKKLFYANRAAEELN